MARLLVRTSTTTSTCAPTCNHRGWPVVARTRWLARRRRRIAWHRLSQLVSAATRYTAQFTLTLPVGRYRCELLLTTLQSAKTLRIPHLLRAHTHIVRMQYPRHRP